MSIISKIFSSGATDLIKEVGGVIDNLTTSKEEKLEAEQKVRDLVLSYEAKMQEQITNRWKSDMQSDSFLSKNVRPMVLIFLVVCTMLLVFIDAGVFAFKVENTWIELIKMTL